MHNTRKLLITIALLIVGTVAAFAGVPQTINYQGFLTAGGGIPASGPVGMVFSLIPPTQPAATRSGGEGKSVTTVNGIYSTQLGSVTLTAPFDVPYWLGVNVNNTGELPLQPLSSVPYSQRAAVADGVSANATLSGQTLSQLDSRYAPTVFTNASSAARISRLRWDQPIQSGTTIPNGTNYSFGITFDGSNIWATNYDGSLRKFRGSDGALLGTYTTNVSAYGVVSDGTHVWVADYATKVRMFNAADGTFIKDITVGGMPTNLAYDGSRIWVACNTNSVIVLNATDGSVLTTITGVIGARWLAFDGSSMWVSSGASNTVYKYNLNGTVGSTGQRDTALFWGARSGL